MVDSDLDCVRREVARRLRENAEAHPSISLGDVWGWAECIWEALGVD